ncbi:MAG TPA: hypothetical protein VHW00_05925 [Thermoanaerobaculia bacterium]|nr:hypothetical protein [Thermoanaerobaculia bacterium]
MPSKRALVVSLVLLAACRREMTTTDTVATNTVPTATTATTSTAPPEQLPACYPAVTAGGPSVLPPAAISGNIPLFVPLPSTINSPTQIRPYFDWFSWQEFIALNWPASTTGRGNPQSPDDPSVFKNAAPGTTTVWSTYKANWELFDQGNQRPTPFDSYDVPVSPTCGTGTVPGAGQKKTLVMTSKGNSVLNDGVQAFSFPLVDNAQDYVMYEVRYGRQPYEFMRGTDNNPKSWLYLAKNLIPPSQITMPPTQSTHGASQTDQLGSIMIKAAWRDMAAVPKDQWTRYYVVEAEVFDPSTQKCTDTSVGLVGLHIVQKLDLFPEWVWSTFEHVDVVSSNPQNTLLQQCPSGDTACTQNGFKNRPDSTNLNPDKSARVPVQVLRLNAIPTTPQGASTVDANTAFQTALAGTPWANYQLVVTQWPFAANDMTQYKPPEQRGTYPCTSGLPFPVTGAVNLTMETYFQSPDSAAGSGNSCMACHFGAAYTDFSWGLKRRPHA